MSRRPDALGQAASFFSPRRSVLFYVLAGVILFAAGCKKKSPPLSSATIREITHELVLAARSAGGGRAEVGMRPEYSAGQTGKQQTLLADHIYITLPASKSGAPDRAARDSILAELQRVAEYHRLQRVLRPGAPGLERFDYLRDGRRTQSIHLITPLAKAESAPFSHSPSGARLAIVVDDLGNDRAQADALFRIAYPLTISVLPHEADSGEIAEEAHRRGFQVMLHLPMAASGAAREEAVELRPGMAPDAVEKTFTEMLDTVPYAAGVNNHEGSLGTVDQELMDELMVVLRRHDLFFIDSRTTVATVAETTARAAGVAAARRNVFLDDEQSVSAIRKQFALAVQDARKNGSALAIGHPHPQTLEVLAEMMPRAQHEGIQLVFASDLAR